MLGVAVEAVGVHERVPVGRERVALGAPHLKYAASLSTTPMAFVRSPRDALSTSSTVGLPLRYCLYTLFVRWDRVVLPFPLPPRGASPTCDPALNRSGPVRKWMALPVSLFFALGLPATITDAPRPRRARVEDR